MSEMRSESRSSSPIDFYPSGGGGSYTRKRTKVELATVLAIRSGLVFTAIGLLCWGTGWLLSLIFGSEYGLVARGAAGGGVIGLVCGIAMGVRNSRSRVMAILVISLLAIPVIALFGALLGLIVGALSTSVAWPVGGAVLGLLIGAGIGLWKGE